MCGVYIKGLTQLYDEVAKLAPVKVLSGTAGPGLLVGLPHLTDRLVHVLPVSERREDIDGHPATEQDVETGNGSGNEM